MVKRRSFAVEWRSAGRRSPLAAVGEHVLSGCLGAAAVLGFAPFHYWPITIAALAGLYLLIDRAPNWRRAAARTWVFGLGFFAAGLQWIGNSFFVDAERFGAMAIPAVAGLAASLAIFPALAGALTRMLASDMRPLAFSAAWCLTELLRGMILSGFPWNLIGYVWTVSDVTLQLASVVGAYGLSFITIFAASTIGWGISSSVSRQRRLFALAVAASTLAMPWVYGSWRLAYGATNEDSTLRIRIVQGNIPQNMKWRIEDRERVLARYTDLSNRPAEGVFHAVIWPETAVPYVWDGGGVLVRRLAAVLPPGAILITGIIRQQNGAGAERFYNSVVAVSRDAVTTPVYDKVRLVPFGEYVPLRWLLPFRKLTVGTTDLSAGPEPKSFESPGIPAFQPLICYEAIFPGDLPKTGPRPLWLINVTNDAWFGTSIGPYQHFQMARTRAVERGVPLVRAANTGISAVIDSYGRIRHLLPLGEIGVIDAVLPSALPNDTIYARFADWPLLGLCAFILISGMLWPLHRKRAQGFRAGQRR